MTMTKRERLDKRLNDINNTLNCVYETMRDLEDSHLNETSVYDELMRQAEELEDEKGQIEVAIKYEVDR